MSGNFGPIPGGSTILMQTVGKMVLYADSKGKTWRYMHAYDQRWPVDFSPSIDIKKHGCATDGAAVAPIPPLGGLTPTEIEDLI